MRPEILFPLFSSPASLYGVGPHIARLVTKICGPHVLDLLWHLPRDIVERPFCPGILAAIPGQIVTLNLQVVAHHPAIKKGRPYRVICQDAEEQITLIFFKADERYLSRILPTGEDVTVSGKVELFAGNRQIAHPDYVVPRPQAAEIPLMEAVYPITAGLTKKNLTKLIAQTLKISPDLPEWHDPHLIKRKQWPSWLESLKLSHHPEGISALSFSSGARERLAYDEILANQLALGIMRHSARKRKGFSIAGDAHLRNKVRSTLPFQLTESQEKALTEINADMMAPVNMLRLLQGDVGSGKTIIALMAMLNAVECGYQAVFMAPTEILAYQHLETIQTLTKESDVSVQILTGRSKGKSRRMVLEKLASGDIDILVGTHAIFQDDVHYHNLAFVVIDEQHRFGVHQRLAIARKGAASGHAIDMLVMTATPIPRTLMMSAYGDLETSVLNEKPPGRKPVRSVVISEERTPDVIERLKGQIAEGRKVYWICPLVEDSDQLELTAAQERYKDLVSHLGKERVALIHGRMKTAEKDEAMQKFIVGEARFLVATTVIEVGVDVPDATIMVIEHAERFGLAQLHQLRGRVGRGNEDSTCILLRSKTLTNVAKQRLRIISQTENGFLIAEKDLELRGAGEILGTKQSGLPEFRFCDLAIHGELMHMALNDARLVLEKDPRLQSPRGKALRILLYLFEHDGSVQLLRSG